jgi:hypothetical protein
MSEVTTKANRPTGPKPEWLKIRLNTGGEYKNIQRLMNEGAEISYGACLADAGSKR